MMKARRIQIIYSRDTFEVYNRRSALGSYIHCFASILVKHGYEVRLNNIPFPGEGKGGNGLTQHRAGRLGKRIPAFLKELMKDMRLFRHLRNLYDKIDQGFNADRIIEFYTYGSDIGARLSAKHGIPLILLYDNPVLEEHSYFNPGQLFFKGAIERKERRSVLAARSVVVYSDAVKEYLNAKFRKNLPLFIHQNVDFTRFEFVEEKSWTGTINIAFIGSFLKWHRVDLLIEAFTRLRMEGKDVRLYLLGSGMEFDAIRESLSGHPCRERIELTGFVDGDQLSAYKKMMHIGVMPGSNWYGAPNKIFEYAAANMAVVAPGTPTIRCLFEDKKDLFLFEPDDVTGLYLRLKECVENPGRMRAMAGAIQLRIRSAYSEERTFAFYNELIK